MSLRTSMRTAFRDCVTRTAPSRRPPSTIGRAVKRMSSPSEALWRSPCAVRPASAVRISGRLAYEPPAAGAAESTSRRPAESTTMTRPAAAFAAVRTIGASAARSSRRPAALLATTRAWSAAWARTSASTRLDRLSASGTSSATSISTSTYANARSCQTRTLIASAPAGSRHRQPSSNDALSSLRAVRAGGGEHEADAAHRVDVARRGRVVAELLAQAADVDVECLRRAEPVDVPDLVDEPLPCDDGAGAAHEQREQVELLAGRLDRCAGPRHGPRGRVEADVADLDRRVLVGRRGRRGGATQHGADAGRDLAGAERLDDVVVGAELEPDHAVGLLAAGGQHDDRHLRLAPDLAADVVARAVGEHEVEQDEVGADGRRLLESGGGGAGDLEMEALAREGLGEGLRDGRLVLDQEDRPPAGCHVHIVGGHRSFAAHTTAPAGWGGRRGGGGLCGQSSPPWPPPPRPPRPPLSSPAPPPPPRSSPASRVGPPSAPPPPSSPA